MEHYKHRPVLFDPVIELLNIGENDRYIDATYGRGGHAQGILERLGPQGCLMLIDRDPEAIADATGKYARDPRVLIRKGAFSRLKDFIDDAGWAGRVSGILFDLGVSSPQLDDPSRGFSFQNDGPLDMRMDPETGASAAEWLQQAPEKEIANVLWEYGEERFSRRIARNIVNERVQRPIDTTAHLADVVKRSMPPRKDGKHPATRTFQAIRIFINDELGQLGRVLSDAFNALRPGGRLAVISFHSLEDRVVKRFMTDLVAGPRVPAHIPVTGKSFGRAAWVEKRRLPDEFEIAENPRARSSVLRVIEARQS